MTDEELAPILERLSARAGTTTAATTTEVDRSMIRRFARAVGEDNPLHHDEAFARASRFGTLVAPPTFVAAFIEGHFPEIVVQDLPFERMLHAHDEISMSRPIRAGDVVTAFARYEGAQVKRSARGLRLYQWANLVLTAAGGESIANVRISTVSF